MVLDEELAALELFSACDARALGTLADALAVQQHEPGAVLVREGEQGDSFLVILDGCVRIASGDGGERDVRHAGAGAILGELAMLTARPRMATITAETSVRTAVGDRGAFDLLVDLPGVSELLAVTVARRLAETARTVPVTLGDGSAIALRPLLPEDHDELVDLVGRQSAQWLRHRFFTSGAPSRGTIEHLANINYIDHFAWVAVAAASKRGAGIGRYTRLRDDHATAELAFGVVPEHEGRGIATLLLGALAVTAATAGITHFTAEVLYDNAPMRAVFHKVGAQWTYLERGVGSTRFEVASATGLVDDELADTLVSAARDIVTGAGLALAQPARS